MEQNNNQAITNTTIELSHGLLSEDFKQNLLNLLYNHKLDIQTKVIILDSVLLSANIVAKQQDVYKRQCIYCTIYQSIIGF